MKPLLSLFFCLFAFAAIAQQRPTDVDKSPADISYCPQNYPILKMNGKTSSSPVARLIYSRPQKAGREIFGGIVGYDEVWRLGANEATEIEFFSNVKIDGKPLAKGRYTLYAICESAKWTLIFNTEKDIWGLSYNPKKDVLRVDVPVQKSTDTTETFTMYFDDMHGKAQLNILWDDTKVSMPFTY